MKQEMYSHIQTVEQNHWWYVARRKIIFDWVLNTLQNYENPNILDIGCGTGFNIEQLNAYGYQNAIGLDFAGEGLNFCRGRHLTHLICADGAIPPMVAKSFEMIMALDMIEHLKDDTLTLHEFARLLKPGGALVIFTPAFNFLWGIQDEVSHHYRRYTAGELRQKVEQTGLHIQKLTYANTFLFPLIWAGRIVLRLTGNKIKGQSENDLHPGWSNKILQNIFAAERPILQYMNFPFGVSLLCVAYKSG